jgi:ATP-binding cassette subfamily C protein LapB
LALLQIYDRIIPNSSHDTLTLLLAGVASAVVLEAVLRIARADIISWGGTQFEHRAACDAFRHVMAAPADELERVGPGELIERLGGLPTVREVFSEHWTLVVCDLPFVFLFLGLIAYIGGWLVLAPTVVLGAFVAFALFGHNAHHKAISAFNQVRDRRQNFSIEVIHGIHSVKALAMEAQMVQRYARLQEAVAGHSHKVVQVNSHALGVGGVFSQLLTLSVVVAGGMMVVDNALTVGGLSACTLLAGRALQPIQKAVGLWTRWQTARMMRQRFETVFDLRTEPQPEVPVIRPVVGAVELKNVRWRAAAEGDELFTGINLRVRPGERVAIAGDNGSGKGKNGRGKTGSESSSPSPTMPFPRTAPSGEKQGQSPFGHGKRPSTQPTRPPPLSVLIVGGRVPIDLAAIPSFRRPNLSLLAALERKIPLYLAGITPSPGERTPPSQ